MRAVAVSRSKLMWGEQLSEDDVKEIDLIFRTDMLHIGYYIVYNIES